MDKKNPINKFVIKPLFALATLLMLIIAYGYYEHNKNQKIFEKKPTYKTSLSREEIERLKINCINNYSHIPFNVKSRIYKQILNRITRSIVLDSMKFTTTITFPVAIKNYKSRPENIILTIDILSIPIEAQIKRDIIQYWENHQSKSRFVNGNEPKFFTFKTGYQRVLPHATECLYSISPIVEADNFYVVEYSMESPNSKYISHAHLEFDKVTLKLLRCSGTDGQISDTPEELKIYLPPPRTQK